MRLFQSIADFFYLSWHLLRSLFMSQEALEREIAEMRQQICIVHKPGSRVLYPKGKILMTKNKVFWSAIALFAGSIFAVSAWAQQPAPKLTMKMLKPDVWVGLGGAGGN